MPNPNGGLYSQKRSKIMKNIKNGLKKAATKMKKAAIVGAIGINGLAMNACQSNDSKQDQVRQDKTKMVINPKMVSVLTINDTLDAYFKDKDFKAYHDAMRAAEDKLMDEYGVTREMEIDLVTFPAKAKYEPGKTNAEIFKIINIEQRKLSVKLLKNNPKVKDMLERISLLEKQHDEDLKKSDFLIPAKTR
jgi:hypothetical protein